MGTNLPEQHMLDQTLDAFSQGGQSSVSPTQGSTLIDGWINALQGDPNVDGVKQALQELKDQLQATEPDSGRIRSLLIDLAAQAADFAQGPNAEGTWTGKLERVSKILDEFSHQL